MSHYIIESWRTNKYDKAVVFVIKVNHFERCYFDTLLTTVFNPSISFQDMYIQTS